MKEKPKLNVGSTVRFTRNAYGYTPARARIIDWINREQHHTCAAFRSKGPLRSKSKGSDKIPDSLLLPWVEPKNVSK